MKADNNDLFHLSQFAVVIISRPSVSFTQKEFSSLKSSPLFSATPLPFPFSDNSKPRPLPPLFSDNSNQLSI